LYTHYPPQQNLLFAKEFTEPRDFVVTQHYTVLNEYPRRKKYFATKRHKRHKDSESSTHLILPQSKAADCVFANAAEVEGAVVFDGVGDFGEAVRRAVLEVLDDAAALVQAQHE
jgi:hypothetical protein